MWRRGAILLAGLAATMFAVAAEPVVYRRPMYRIASIDPLRANSIYDCAAVALAYETLLQVDYVKRPYTLAPGLANLPQVSADGLEYVFKLEKGHHFRNGREVVAGDLVFALHRLADLANASSGSWVMKDVASVVAVDDTTLKFTLKQPVHYFPWLMTLPYTVAVAPEEVERLGAAFGSEDTGSGPYRLVEWRRNHNMRFVRNPDWPHWKDVPGNLDVIEYLHVEDPSTKWLMFLRGELDYLFEVARDNWDAVVGKDGKIVPALAEQGITLHSLTKLEVDYVGINMEDPVLGPNRKLRQALNAAFDGEAWRRFSNGASEPATGPIPHGVKGRLETPFAYSYDLEKAKKLLVEAGYPGGIDPKTGRRLVLSLALGRPTQDMRESVELMASFYEKIGIVLEPRFYVWDAFLKAVDDRRVQMFRIGWIGDYPDAQNFLQMFYSPNASPGPNHANYHNPEFDASYTKALSLSDEAARNQEWARAQEIVREDCPWIFLSYRRDYMLLRPGFTNYIPTDFAYGVEKYLRKEPSGNPALQ